MAGFLTNVFSNALAAVIGIVLGIPVAFWINRRISAVQESRDRIRGNIYRLKTAHRVFNTLRDEIVSNRNTLAELIKDLPHEVVFYNLSTSAWTSTTEKMVESI